MSTDSNGDLETGKVKVIEDSDINSVKVKEEADLDLEKLKVIEDIDKMETAKLIKDEEIEVGRVSTMYLTCT